MKDRFLSCNTENVARSVLKIKNTLLKTKSENQFEINDSIFFLSPKYQVGAEVSGGMNRIDKVKAHTPGGPAIDPQR